jgi:hypothetical protein
MNPFVEKQYYGTLKEKIEMEGRLIPRFTALLYL